jgi:hypothetical protein
MASSQPANPVSSNDGLVNSIVLLEERLWNLAHRLEVVLHKVHGTPPTPPAAGASTVSANGIVQPNLNNGINASHTVVGVLETTLSKIENPL